MASIQDFRNQIALMAKIVVHENSFESTGLLVFFESPDSWSDDEVQGPNRFTLQEGTVDSTDNFRQTDPELQFAAIQHGQKIFQLRVWVIEQTLAADSNQGVYLAGVEILVHRKLAYPDEEYLYVRDEMLVDQATFVTQVIWTNLSTVQSLVENPTIDIPTRNADVIQYTVSAVCAVLLD